jgi:hypothetical protein
MTASFSKKNSKAAFKKHYPHEVVSNVNDSKLLANALSNTSRYQYTMEVTVIGNSDIRPYDPIYLDNLPNDLSGYWTVLSVSHKFNDSRGYYLLDLVVGAETLGDVNVNASKAVQYRDVEGEIAGQALTVAESQLTEISLSPNSSEFQDVDYDGVGPKVTQPSNSFSNLFSNPYLIKPPSLKSVKNTVSWSAKKGGKII